jgi:thiamine-phosphate pyrophosphorylase
MCAGQYPALAWWTQCWQWILSVGNAPPRRAINSGQSMLLCYVTDRLFLSKSASQDKLLQHIEWASAAGIDWIQVREKDLSARELLDFTRRAIAAVNRAAVQKRTPSVLVNDRIDVALAAGAAGVHLSWSSIPPAEAVNWLRDGNAPKDFSVGVSCHSLAEAIPAEKAGANYIFFGPVYETPAKLSFGAPQGIEKLAEVCRNTAIPVVAIGGVTEANALSCIRAGASGIAAIRMFQQAQDSPALAAIVSRLRSAR